MAMLLPLAALAGCIPAATVTPLAETNTPLLASSTDPSSVELTLTADSVIPTASISPTTSSTATDLASDFWQSLPVIPHELSARSREIYALGQEMGNDARNFSRIGDCNSAAPAFLVGFGEEYNLAEFGYLQPAIDYFQESFARPSYAARAGLNTSGVLSTLWTAEICLAGESLLACQYRLDLPAFAIISLGTNESYYEHHDPGVFERNLRVILDETIARGILPILATKADNLEGDHVINATIARLALEYDLPLWNFWLAVQHLPDNGLLETEHLTTVSHRIYTDFTMPHAMERGMQIKNLTALQMLFFLMQELALAPVP